MPNAPSDDSQLDLFFGEPIEEVEPSGVATELRVPELRFLGWDRPPVELAAEALLEGSNFEVGVDLGETLVVIPGRGARRELSDALLRAVRAGGGRGILSPEMRTPGGMMDGLAKAGGSELASPEQILATWMEVVRTTRPETVSSLLPSDATIGDGTFARFLGRDLVGVSAKLSEAGLGFSDVNEVSAGAESGGNPERARWDDLAGMERRYFGMLRESGLRCPHEALRAALGEPIDLGLGARVKRVVVIGVADPPEVFVKMLGALVEGLSLEVWVFAPEDEKVRFDSWGRPLPESWAMEAGMEISIPDERLHLLADPAEQAAVVSELLGNGDGLAGLGLCDDEVADVLGRRLKEEGKEAYDPRGLPLAGSMVAGFVAAVGEVLGDQSFGSVARLVRHPLFLGSVARRSEKSGAELISALDNFQARRHPATLEAGRAMAESSLVGLLLDEVERLLRPLQKVAQGRGDATLTKALESVLERVLTGGVEIDERDLEYVTQLLAGAAALEAAPGKRGLADDLEVLSETVGQARWYPTWTGDALVLDGWLESLWSPRAQVVVAGANEGVLPKKEGGEAFLPEPLRRALGIQSDEVRLARDAFALAALVASRKGRGQVDVMLGKQDLGGEPLRPSRLILMVAGETLAQRVGRVFGEPDSPVGKTEVALPWSATWKLDFPSPSEESVKKIVSLSPTSLRDYLACPFEFYLKRVMGMREHGPGEGELDAPQYGTLCHEALRKLGEDEVMRDETDSDVIRDFLIAELDGLVAEEYGSPAAIPVQVQVESLRKRLGWAALRQAEVRAEGWRIIAAEEDLGADGEWEIDGMPFKGQMDRLDEHEETGDLRVIDYKTGGKGKRPEEAHWKSAGRTLADEDEWMLYSGAESSKPKMWSELQLPLYASYVEQRWGRSPEVGYFNLPRTVAATRILMWNGLDEGARESAAKCAEEIVKRVRDGVYWPPKRKSGAYGREGELDRLFTRPEEVLVDFSALTGAKEDAS